MLLIHLVKEFKSLVECSELLNNNNNLLSLDRVQHLDSSNSLLYLEVNNNLGLGSSRHLYLGSNNSRQVCSVLNLWVNKLQPLELNQPLEDNSLEEISSQQAVSLDQHHNPAD